MHGAGIGEAHLPAHSANPMKPPTIMDPDQAPEEAIIDPGHWDSWGQILGKKQHDMIWICFQNIGGIIPQANEGLKLTELQSFTQQHKIDIFSFHLKQMNPLY